MKSATVIGPVAAILAGELSLQAHGGQAHGRTMARAAKPVRRPGARPWGSGTVSAVTSGTSFSVVSGSPSAPVRDHRRPGRRQRARDGWRRRGRSRPAITMGIDRIMPMVRPKGKLGMPAIGLAHILEADAEEAVEGQEQAGQRAAPARQEPGRHGCRSAGSGRGRSPPSPAS